MTDGLSPVQLANAVKRIHGRIDELRDALDAADRVMGDGDTGMTIASVVAAWNGVIARDHPDVATLLQQLGRETRRATGSSLGSVLAIGLTAAGKSGGSPVEMLDAAATAITERSGAAAGDKTILDSLLAVRDALTRQGSAVDAAQQALEDFRSREAKVGRARIYGAKSIGHDDPGMLAALLLLRTAQS